MPDDANPRAGNNGWPPSWPAADAGGLPDDLFEEVLAEQRRDWITGKRNPAGERLRQYPALAADPAQAAELVYHQFLLQQELGEAPDWEDCLRQVPPYAAMLRELRQADEMVEQAQTSAEEALKTPAPFGGYDLLEKIGQGGMSVVYKARQKSLDRLVALKMIRAGESADEDKRKRFRQEAEAVARLQHPNIVQIYEVGEVQGQPFLALEYVEGESLAQRLGGTPLPARQAASLLEVLARAMHYAHEQGVIHRDLKPSNVLLGGMPETAWERCVPKITDFGLAKRVDKAGDTASGQVLGTPSYMAPEQAEPRTAAIDRRTDVYGLGVILYELLTGRRPFLADSPLQTVKQILEAEPARPRLLNAAVPADLETICLKCLEKEPGRRYATAEALAEDLQRFLSGEPIRARPVGALERGWRWCRRKPVIAGLIAAFAFAVAGGSSGSVLQWLRAEANLKREQAARQEAEENYASLREMVVQTTDHSFDQTRMLRDVKSCLMFLLQRRDEDPRLRTMLANVLILIGENLVGRKRYTEAVVHLQRAASLWEELPPKEAGDWQNRMWRARMYFCLERAYEQQGLSGQAQQSFTTAFELWRELQRELPSATSASDTPIGFFFNLSRILIPERDSDKEVALRFEEIRHRLDRMGGGPEGELFLDLLRVRYLCVRMESYQSARRSADLLAAAREAASVLARLLARASLHRNARWLVADSCLRVSLFLRRAKAYEEALRLSQQVNRALQELGREAPHDHRVLVVLSQSWYEIGKIHWDLHQTEETLTGYRKALEAQRRLFSLHPDLADIRQVLGGRYAGLGRKLCELGRLDEAEACFRERLALWPGDAGKYAEALQDLRQWAAEVGEDPKNLSPAEQQERQRYLDLCSRLERKGFRTALMSGGVQR